MTTALDSDERNILGALAWALAANNDALLIRLCLGSANYWNSHSRTAARETVSSGGGGGCRAPGRRRTQ